MCRRIATAAGRVAIVPAAAGLGRIAGAAWARQTFVALIEEKSIRSREATTEQMTEFGIGFEIAQGLATR